MSNFTRRAAATALVMLCMGATLFMLPKPRVAQHFSVVVPELPQDWQAEYDEEWEDEPVAEGCGY